MRIKVGTTHELAHCGSKSIAEKGIDILICFHQKKFYAFQKYCPHAKGDLAQGILENGFIRCVNHGLKFNLNDGQIDIGELDEDLVEQIGDAALKKFRLITYAVIQQGSELYIDL